MSDVHLLDRFVVASAFSSFLGFLSLHLITFRFFKAEKVLKSLKDIFLVVLLSYIFFAFFWWKTIFPKGLLPGPASPIPDLWGLALGMTLSLFIFTLLTVGYVFWIFGPYETSIRMRLIRELYQGPRQGMELGQLLKNYNAQEILKRRLVRLVSSQELVREKERYSLGCPVNVFFFIDWAARKLGGLMAVRTRGNSR